MLPSTPSLNLLKSLLNTKFTALFYSYFVKTQAFTQSASHHFYAGYFSSSFLPTKQDSSRCSEERQPKHHFYILWLMCLYPNGLFARPSWLFFPQKEVKTPGHFSYKTNSLEVGVFDVHVITIWLCQSYPEGWNQGTANELFFQLKKDTVFKVFYFSFIWFFNTVISFIYQHCQSEMFETRGSHNQIFSRDLGVLELKILWM